MAEIVGAFPATIAMDDRNNIIREAEAYVYATTDTTFSSPLPITDLQGVPFTGGKLVASNGQYPQFRPPAGVEQVYVKSGDRVTMLTDVGVFAAAAKAAAADALAAAGTAGTAKSGAELARTKADEAAAAAAAVGNTNDTIIEGRINATGSKTELALRDKIVDVASQFAAPTRGPLSGIGKAASGKYRVLLGGTSKADAIDSPAKAFVRQLQVLYGRARTVFLGFSTDGGTDAAYLGWDKQHFIGVNFMRVRGSSASTVRNFTFYGDTVTSYFSREADSTAVDILIDGVVVGQTPSAGTQTFGVKQTFTGLSPTARHTLTVNVPAGAGYVFMERHEFSYAADTGVEFLEAAHGGSSLWNMAAYWPKTTRQIDPIGPVAGTDGVAAWLEPNVDLFIGQWTVNDAGSHNALMDLYAPLWASICDRALTQGQQVITVVEMGAHYAAPGDADHADFERLASVQRALGSRNNVTVVDFHTATIMDDIVAYAARYFPGAGTVNPTAGTWTGSDFIHEGVTAYGPCLAVLCAKADIPAPTATLATAVEATALNAYRKAIPALRTATVAGAPKNLPQVGASYQPVTGSTVPLLSDVTVASPLSALVDGATTADGFGKYKLTNNDYVTVSAIAGTQVFTVTVVSVGSASIRIDNARLLDEFGNVVPYEDPTNRRTRVGAYSTQPLTWSFQVSTPDGGTPGLVMQTTAGVGWKLYGLWLSPSPTPVIHPSAAAPSVSTLVTTALVVAPGSNSYAEPAGIALSTGVWMVTVNAVRADNGAHGATAVFMVVNGGGRFSTQQMGATVALNAVTALALSVPASGVVKATATANAVSYTITFTYTAVRYSAAA